MVEMPSNELGSESIHR